MARIKGRDTKPELVLRRALWALGVRGWRCHRKDLPGRPDIAFGRARLAIFVDGAFWHGHPSKFKAGQSGEFWDRKIAQNVARDQRVDAELSSEGWTVVRVWDFDVLDNPVGTAERIQDHLRASS
jgi:DNA mismatch endonuclease (patch repair protein)